MSVYHPDENATPKSPLSSDSAICTWPFCGHTAKGQCRGAARRIQLFTDDQLAAAVADTLARAERAEAALAVAEEALQRAASYFGGCSTDRPFAAWNNVRNALAKIAALKGTAE